jgi:3-hydroxybutyryl-CoA dehydrogenase
VSSQATNAPHKDRIVGVVGAGTMGAGIAQVAAQAGFIVETLDANPEVVRKAFAGIEERLDRQVEKKKLPQHERDETMARLRVAGGYDAFKDAELVIEAVPEDVSLKRRVLADVAAKVSPRAVIATNTSSISVAKLADGLPKPERFLGMHFFNPAPVMNLVELVSGPQTDQQTMVLGVAFANAFNKTPIKVKDSPGFVVNRVARPFYLESLAMLEAGVADVQTIDAAIRDVGKFPMGPFQLLDLIGLDVNLAVTRTVYEGFDKPARFAPSPIQIKLVEQGRLGRKSGRGFYDYSTEPPTRSFETPVRTSDGWKPTAVLTTLAQALGKPADRAMYLYARIIVAIINEAALTAGTIALPREIDLGMKLGLNYPDGPMEIADFIGLDVVRDLMVEFAKDDSSGRYQPAPLLLERIKVGKLGEKTAHGFLRHSL